jgi:hypothetical protein
MSKLTGRYLVWENGEISVSAGYAVHSNAHRAEVRAGILAYADVATIWTDVSVIREDENGEQKIIAILKRRARQ